MENNFALNATFLRDEISKLNEKVSYILSSQTTIEKVAIHIYKGLKHYFINIRERGLQHRVETYITQEID